MYVDFISLLEKSIRHNWNRNALSDYGGVSHRYSDVARKVAKLHILFKHAGIKPGDRIAIYGRNSAQWSMAFIASISYGAVAVLVLFLFEGEVEHFHHVFHIMEIQTAHIVFLDVEDVAFVVDADNQIGDAIAFGCQHLFLDAANRQHLASQGDFARHG